LTTSNYNDFYVATGTNNFVGYNLADKTALSDWQTSFTPNKDLNSKNVDPSFSTSTNLHSSSSILNAAATPITIAAGYPIDVLTDIDGQSRDATTPDIGADEFTVSSIDMGATALVSPPAGGCYSSSQTVTVTIKNYGGTTMDFH